MSGSGATIIVGGSTVFTKKIATSLPTIPGLRTLVYFGTGPADSINLQSGGPALTTMGAPVFASNYVNLGLQAGLTRHDAIDTNVTRDAAYLASGFTWGAVVRTANLAGANIGGMIWADLKGQAASQYWGATAGGNAPGKMTNVVGNINRGQITLTKSITLNWHFVALSYSGGGTGTWILYDFTENPTTGIPNTWATTGITWTAGLGGSMHFGSTSGEGQAFAPIEHAFGFNAQSVLSAAALANIYAALTGLMATRGIVC